MTKKQVEEDSGPVVTAMELVVVVVVDDAAVVEKYRQWHYPAETRQPRHQNSEFAMIVLEEGQEDVASNLYSSPAAAAAADCRLVLVLPRVELSEQEAKAVDVLLDSAVKYRRVVWKHCWEIRRYHAWHPSQNRENSTVAAAAVAPQHGLDGMTRVIAYHLFVSCVLQYQACA